MDKLSRRYTNNKSTKWSKNKKGAKKLRRILIEENLMDFKGLEFSDRKDWVNATHCNFKTHT